MRTKLLRYDADLVVPCLVSRQLIERMGEDWSPPCEIKFVEDDRGLCDIATRYCEVVDA